MDSFPLLELPAPLLIRFISLLPSDDAQELGSCNKILNSLVKLYAYKTVENLHIHGKVRYPLFIIIFLVVFDVG